MRVISGYKRGLKLKTPIGETTRPTEDRVKENVFNILGQVFYEKKALDLFSGTGQIGIEFLSRGADAVFVEKDKKVLKILKENLIKSSYSAKIIEKDVLTALLELKGEFDYIYLDPPYDDEELYEKTVKLIFELNLLDSEGFVIVEERTGAEHDFSNYFKLYKKKKYGSTTVGFWSKK